jgi:NADP-dependent 3-hydroxy acid dehydrogenase YdfG
MDQYFKDKNAIITGAGTGLGLALTMSLLQKGARVMATDVDGAKLDKIRADLANDSNQLATEIVDVRNKNEFTRCVGQTLEKWGRLDILINNAGVCSAGEIIYLEDRHWTNIMETNLMGTINGCRAAVPVMREQGFGHIVNIASIAGLVPFPVTAPYNISKSGIVALSRTLRMEMAGSSINTTLVCPGQLNTSMFTALPTANIRREIIDENNPFKPVNIDLAANKILKAMRKKKFLLVFPFYARLLWWTYRLFPGMTDAIFRKKMAGFRNQDP